MLSHLAGPDVICFSGFFRGGDLIRPPVAACKPLRAMRGIVDNSGATIVDRSTQKTKEVKLS
jgi:hypothetical protein